MNEWVQIISSMGFPIACCVAIGFYLKYVQDRNHEQIKEITKSHKEEIDSVKEALTNNTLAINKLVILMERSEKEHGQDRTY